MNHGVTFKLIAFYKLPGNFNKMCLKVKPFFLKRKPIIFYFSHKERLNELYLVMTLDLMSPNVYIIYNHKLSTHRSYIKQFSTNHVSEFQCNKNENFRKHMLLLWQNNVPMSIEVRNNVLTFQHKLHTF